MSKSTMMFILLIVVLVLLAGVVWLIPAEVQEQVSSGPQKVAAVWACPKHGVISEEREQGALVYSGSPFYTGSGLTFTFQNEQSITVCPKCLAEWARGMEMKRLELVPSH